VLLAHRTSWMANKFEALITVWRRRCGH